VSDGVSTCSVLVSSNVPLIVVRKPRRWTLGWRDYQIGSSVTFRQDPENPGNARIAPIQVGSVLLLLATGAITGVLVFGGCVWLIRGPRKIGI
jgi:hypothetical protein